MKIKKRHLKIIITLLFSLLAIYLSRQFPVGTKSQTPGSSEKSGTNIEYKKPNVKQSPGKSIEKTPHKTR